MFWDKLWQRKVKEHKLVIVKHRYQKAWDENHEPYPKGTEFIEECAFCNCRENLVICEGTSGFTGCGSYLCLDHSEFYPDCPICHKSNESQDKYQRQLAKHNLKPMMTASSAIITNDTPCYYRETENGFETFTCEQYQQLLRGEDVIQEDRKL